MLVPIKDNGQQKNQIRKYYTENSVPYHREQDHTVEQQPSDEFCQCEILNSYDPHISSGEMVAKLPVLLAELTFQAKVKAIITFPEFVLEIKDVSKRLFITQCRLLLPSNKLFIKGFVRKNILYDRPLEEKNLKTKTSITSDLHSISVDIPIQCMTEIKKYISQPVLSQMNEKYEFEFPSTKPLPTGFPEKDQDMSSDLSSFHQESNQYYNELPYCELVSSKIIEWDEAIDRQSLPFAPLSEEGYFRKMEDKMVINFTIKVLQNQQVLIKSSMNNHEQDVVND